MNKLSYSYRFIFAVLFLPVLVVGQVLNVPEVIQEQDQWCWAGVSCCVLRYYQTNITQCEIAEYTRTHANWHDFGPVDCCVDPSQGCNYWNYNWGYPGSIQDILHHWGVENYGTGYLQITNIQSEIDGGRPFIIRWGWTTGGGHFLVGHGIVGSAIYYMNPWFGEGYKIGDYGWVLGSTDHTWTHTNVLTTNSVPPISVLETPSDSAVVFSTDVNFRWLTTPRTWSYDFQLSYNAGFDSLLVDTTALSDTTCLITNLSTEAEYWWRVCASNTYGHGSWSVPRYFTIGMVTCQYATGWNITSLPLNAPDCRKCILFPSAV
jgi:hypothetical protein